jgi:glycerate 2-kinase
MYDAAVSAAHPGNRLKGFLPAVPAGRTVVIGAGKAACQMAATLDASWDGPLTGLVITRYGSATSCGRIEVAEAAHPVPDAAGQLATTRMLSLLDGLTANDLVIALISGGGSALLAAPAEGLDLEDERAINEALLISGAPIAAMNLIRNQFSTVKGGRLALACGDAPLVTLIVSDIPGDDPTLVASGPTLPMAKGRPEAAAAAKLYGIRLPEAARTMLASERNLPPQLSDPHLARHQHHVIASASLSLSAAKEVAVGHGLPTHILSDAFEGESHIVGRMHGAIAREVVKRGQPFSMPCVILSGGETTVTVRGTGRGGRNTEFLMGLALAIDGVDGIVALAADTDGIDGSEGNAGAFADGTTIQRMRAIGYDPLDSLHRNDCFSAFAAIGDLFVTGPTGTNVNDFRAINIALP